MKRSEFKEKFLRGYGGRTSLEDVQVMISLAEDAGVQWDPETDESRRVEPEVLWEGPETEDVWPQKVLTDSTVWQENDGEWEEVDDPMGRELARRILEEGEAAALEQQFSAEAQKNLALQAELRAMLDAITGLRSSLLDRDQRLFVIRGAADMAVQAEKK